MNFTHVNSFFGTAVVPCLLHYNKE